MNPASSTAEAADLADDERDHAHPQRPVGIGELVVGVLLHAVGDVAEDRDDEEEHQDHRRGQVDPCRPRAQLDEHRDQQGGERVQQRRAVRDVDVGMGAVLLRDQHLAVLPHAEHQGEQENQPGRQQGDLDVQRQRPYSPLGPRTRGRRATIAQPRTTVGIMRFAFKTSPQNTTWAEMLAVWQAADDIDVFESGWTFDHFYPIFSDSTGPCLEGWTTLTALAQATKPLRLGTLVTGIHYRHPAVLANMAAALDVISNGRLELGIGAGWNEEESGAYGIELGSIKERFDRFEEACEVLTSLLSNETTNFDGKFYQLKDARNEPKGPQRPHPPICIGGSGEKRTLRITAQYAAALELRRWPAGDVRPQARRAGVALRRHRPRPEGDHHVGTPAPGTRPRTTRR